MKFVLLVQHILSLAADQVMSNHSHVVCYA